MDYNNNQIQNPPSTQAFNPQQFTNATQPQAKIDTSMFQTAANNAMPSVQSLDTAAARVRSRLSGQNKANTQSIANQFGGSKNVGGYNQSMAQNNAARQNAYAQGLTDLQQDFWNKQQTGAGILGNIGAAMTGAQNTANQIASNFGTTMAGIGTDYDIAGQKNINDWFLGQGGLSNEANKINKDYDISSKFNEGTFRANKANTLSDLMKTLFQFGNAKTTWGFPIYQADDAWYKALGALDF